MDMPKQVYNDFSKFKYQKRRYANISEIVGIKIFTLISSQSHYTYMYSATNNKLFYKKLFLWQHKSIELYIKRHFINKRCRS